MDTLGDMEGALRFVASFVGLTIVYASAMAPLLYVDSEPPKLRVHTHLPSAPAATLGLLQQSRTTVGQSTRPCNAKVHIVGWLLNTCNALVSITTAVALKGVCLGKSWGV